MRVERFWSKVDRRGPDECWPWKGSRNPDGYGSFSYQGRQARAHRMAWMLANGAVPEAGKLICHSCDNPPCCNPAHLWPGTPSDNMKDCYAKGRAPRSAPALNAAKAHCPAGHPFSGDNLVLRKANGDRECRTCIRARNKGWRARARAKAAASEMKS